MAIVWSEVQRLAYGLADAIATPSPLLKKIQNGLSFWYRPTQVVLEKRPLNDCACVCVPISYKNAVQTFAEMCINTHVASGARQAFMLTVRNVFITVWINILFGQAKVNYKYCISLGAGCSTNEEIFRLDITIDQQFGMHIFHTLNLQCNQQHF